jgi:hypothetical protein
MKARRGRALGWLLLWAAALALAQAACGAGSLPLENGESPAAEPSPHEVTTDVPQPTAPPATPAPAITESRVVEIEWPAAIRMGDSDFIRLALALDEGGALAPTAEVAGHETAGERIDIPNLYETHNVLAVAELSAVGLEIDRPGPVSQTLLPGERAEWVWTIAPRTAGEQVATLTLHLRFVPKAGGETSERAVWARRLAIEGRTVLGLSGRAADVLGVAGSVMGAVLGFPFADKLYSWFWRRFVKRKA